VLAMCRDDQAVDDFAGYNVSFDADLSALRGAIYQFGRLTTSQGLSTDDCVMKSCQSLPCRCCHSADDQVSILLHLSSTCLPALSVCSWFSFETFLIFSR